jgi:hypothetical protein
MHFAGLAGYLAI